MGPRHLSRGIWTVDQYGVLQYFPKFASMAPFEVSDANAVFLADSSRVSRTLADFRNVQYAIGGQGITDPITDFWELDGVSRTVPTSYPIVELISVTAPESTCTFTLEYVPVAACTVKEFNFLHPEHPLFVTVNEMV